MWRKIIKWAVYVVPITVFVLLLNAGQLLKRPMGTGDDVRGSLSRLEESVLTEDWQGADAAWERTHRAVGIVMRRVQVDAERDELQDFSEELARLRGAVQAGERAAALEHISVLKALYDEWGR
ncbi:MAG TPA: hypothetical protein VD969_05235 [Symbiobacteriaceae bacterium]|nr:hypothetical protein [Symbiobacteriaceae bacterium]